jgi:hypothetical protein
MSLQATLAVGAGAAGYLKYVGKVPASFADIAREGGDVKAASYAVVASASILGANFVEYLFYGPNGNGPIARCSDFIRTCLGQEKSRKIVVKDWIEEYNQLHKAEDASVRNSAYASLVNHYYELATLFYEVGWCQSFHFAYHMVGESFAEGIRRHEYYLASFLGGLKPGSKVGLRSTSSSHHIPPSHIQHHRLHMSSSMHHRSSAQDHSLDASPHAARPDFSSRRRPSLQDLLLSSCMAPNHKHLSTVGEHLLSLTLLRARDHPPHANDRSLTSAAASADPTATSRASLAGTSLGCVPWTLDVASACNMAFTCISTAACAHSRPHAIFDAF